MNDDLEARYHHTFPVFLKVLPDGFGMDEECLSTIDISIQDEQVERKLWEHGRLLCHSRDGERAAKTDKPCRVCRDQQHCTSQIVLYVLYEDIPYRIPLNYTSAKNYLSYRRELINTGNDPTSVITRLQVIPRGSWGEISFTTLF